MRALFFLLVLPAILISTSCKKVETDTIKPEIDLSVDGAFPRNCDTILFGQSFNLKVRLSDNMELGSISVDIHHNFDHHNHSTEVTECTLDPVKTPINPFVLTTTFDLPEGEKEVVFVQNISIPAGNTIGYFDEGDYHFFISLTDKTGWSAYKGLSIKIKH